jgi:hypothetical protein
VNVANLRQRAAVVRAAPLETVLALCGAARDGHDRCKWHTELGALSITGPKFMNWHTGQGGGGAIDLVMHLAGVDFRTAVAWLEERLGAGPLAAGAPAAHASGRNPSLPEGCDALRMPVRDDRLLGRVRHYLTRRRCLAALLIEPLMESGKLYADRRGNAVFVLVAGKAQRPVGAELRGTGPHVWRGMAPGTRKDLGYFWVGVSGSREIVLCESAIDAISCFEMYPQRICISTSGVRTHSPWLGTLITRGYRLHCGFDADHPGDAAAAGMIAFHPAIQRLRPPAHDWNDALASRR